MSESYFSFRTPKEVIAGRGAIAELGRVVSPLGRRAVLVTGRGAMRRSGILDRAVGLLAGAGAEVSLFEGVERDPDAATVDRIRALIAEVAGDVVIGLGGGSAMDAAKAAGGLAGETEPTSVFVVGQKAAKGGLPVVAVPTTSGTGAEVTPNAVISEASSRVKLSIRNGDFMPAAAIIDPELTVQCPPRVTAESGMDAITQAIESFVSIHATPLSDGLAFEAFRLLWPAVGQAYDDGDDLAARTACSFGSLMAGMALANARLGAVHGIVHWLGARYGVPHGLACAVLLPHVIGINLAYSVEKYRRLADAAGGGLVEATNALNRRFGIQDEFARYNIPEEDYPAIADESLKSGSLKANPKKFTREDVFAVLKAAAGGRGG